jgi:hypothetical protein
MKKRDLPFKMGIFAYLLILPVFLLVNCQNDFDDAILSSEAKLTPDSKVLSLMKAAIISESDYAIGENKESLAKSTDPADDDQCTYFQYPMTFDVYSGDNPTPVQWEINSDEELLAFIDTLMATTNYEYYIYFPITLLDTEGNPTVLYSLTELEGTLSMAVEACAGMEEDPVDANDGTDDGTDGDSDEDSDDGGSDSGTDGGSDGGSDGGTDDSSGDEEDEISQSNDSGYQYCDKNNKKVIICHKGITICISVNALWHHMNHHEEDYEGSCND